MIKTDAVINESETDKLIRELTSENKKLKEVKSAIKITVQNRDGNYSNRNNFHSSNFNSIELYSIELFSNQLEFILII